MSEGKDKTFEIVGKTLGAVDALTEAVRFNEHAYHWKKLKEYAEGLFARAPFKVGDKVRLTKTPEITPEKSWGWMAAKHFMVKGAEATVVSVDFWDGHFNALVVFDDESWLDRDGKRHPVDQPGHYTLWETMIERVPPAPPSLHTCPDKRPFWADCDECMREWDRRQATVRQSEVPEK